MSDELLVNVMPGEIRAAAVAAGELVELYIERRRRASIVGNVYLGRVDRVIPGMDAAFIDIGIGRSGFMGLDAARNDNGPRGEGRISDYLTEGQNVAVQVVKDAIGRKGAQLSRRLALPGRYLVYTPGQSRVAVSRQIEDEAEQTRLAALMAAIAEPDEGFILRTASAGADAEELARDAEFLRMLWVDVEAARDQAEAPALLHGELDPLLRIFRDHVRETVTEIRIDSAEGCAEARRFCTRFMPRVAERIALHDEPTPVFARHDVEDEIARAIDTRLSLPSGGGVVIEATEALTAIDINSGSFTGAANLADTALQTNLEAAAEVARQIRVRNIGGLIVIDFIHMDDETHWHQVVGALEAGLAEDRTHSRVIGLTAAGLVEVTRRRRRESLAQMMTESCDACGGTGRIATAETVAHDVMRALDREARHGRPGPLCVIAAPEVVSALDPDGDTAFGDFAATLGRRLELRADPEYGRQQFDVVVD